MTELEKIKKALEGDMNTGLTAIDRLRFIVGGVPDFDPITVEDADWLISALESLQRENEELRKDREHVAAEKSGIAKNAHSKVDYWKSQFEAAEDEVKRLRESHNRESAAYTHAQATFAEYFAKNYPGPDTIIYNPNWHAPKLFAAAVSAVRTALASTGGEHHAE